MYEGLFLAVFVLNTIALLGLTFLIIRNEKTHRRLSESLDKRDLVQIPRDDVFFWSPKERS